MQEIPPITPGGERAGANSYGTSDPAAQADIDRARTEAHHERQRDRAQLERYVEAGADPDDAETVIEFQHYILDQRAGEEAADETWAGTASRPEQHDAGLPYAPEIHVLDVSSQRKGIDYGMWIDANQDPVELDSDIDDMLQSSPTVGASEWVIDQSRDFAGISVTGLKDIALIATLARGVAEHGAAYAAYVELVGTDDPDLLDKFTDLYIGSYENPESWARDTADDLDWPGQLDPLITDPFLRQYLVIDYARLAREGAQGWDVMKGRDGRTHVFMH